MILLINMTLIYIYNVLYNDIDAITSRIFCFQDRESNIMLLGL